MSAQGIRQALGLSPYLMSGAAIAALAGYLYPFLGIIGWALIGNIVFIPALLAAQLAVVKRLEALIETSPIRAPPVWFERAASVIALHPVIRALYGKQNLSWCLLIQFLILPHEFTHYLHYSVYPRRSKRAIEQWHHILVYQFGALFALNIIFGLILFMPVFTRPQLFARERGIALVKAAMEYDEGVWIGLIDLDKIGLLNEIYGKEAVNKKLYKLFRIISEK